MKGNFHVQFLGEGVAATSPPYPTRGGQPPRSTRPSQDGSPPRGGPCGPGPAAEREARLIDEDNGRMLPPGFFSWRPPVGAPVPRSSGLANRFR